MNWDNIMVEGTILKKINFFFWGGQVRIFFLLHGDGYYMAGLGFGEWEYTGYM